MKTINVIAFCLLNVALAGCFKGASQETAVPGSGSASGDGGLLTPGDGWATEQEVNREAANLTISKMTATERDRVKGDITRNSITWVNSKTGYTLYKLNGSERFDKNAFVMPKVLVIGSVDGGRASLRELPNGEVALTIPIVLIDGSQRDLPYATTRIRIPDSLYLDQSKRELIQKELEDTFGYKHEVTSLGACSQKIVIKIAGVEHDVTPRIFGGPTGPTGCQANQPFTITLQGNKRYIERFLSDEVFNGSAEIAAMYEIAGSFIDEIRLYQIKTADGYTRLRERLITKTDSGETSKEITESEADQLLLPIIEEALSKWASKERFYDRVKNTAVSQMKVIYFNEKQSDKGRLYVLKDTAGFKPYDVPVRVVNESLGRKGELFYSSAIIKPILNSTNIAIRGEERQDLEKAPATGITQDIFTVRENEEYELQLTSAIVHEYEFGEEQGQPKIEDKGLVCLDKPGEALAACRKYKNECIEYKNFCKRPKTGCVRYGTKNSCDTKFNVTPVGCLTLGLFGGCSVDRECHPETDTGVCLEYGDIGCDDWGNYCSQTHQICEPGFDEPICKNQITDLRITKYFSAPAAVNYRVVNAPLGNVDQDIIGGLTLRFKWPDGKNVDCLLLSLLKNVSGQSIRFKVKNNDYCKPFPDGYKGQPVLSLINKVSTKRKDVPCGVMNFSTVEGTKYYGCNGFTAVALTPDQYRPGEDTRPFSYSRSALYLSYYPVVDINGILIARSNAFTSGDSAESSYDYFLKSEGAK